MSGGNKQVEQFILGLNVLCETAGILYKGLLAQSFSKHQAFDIVKTWMVSTMLIPFGNKEESQ